MHCPYCRNTDTRVLDSRVADDGGAIRRRRSCTECGKRFSTVEQMQLVVVKRSGATEPFTRDKAIAGVRKACKGRPVSEDDLACLGQQVEDTLRGDGWAEVPAHEVGMAILSRCASSTRWPTSGSPASTAPSSAPTTSRPRSRCCEPSVPPTRSTYHPELSPCDSRADPAARRAVGKRSAGHTTSPR